SAFAITAGIRLPCVLASSLSINISSSTLFSSFGLAALDGCACLSIRKLRRIEFRDTDSSHPLMSATPNKKILIIEDEADVVDMLALQLRKAGGFTIATAEDGAHGLTKARGESPDLIVLDLMLPRLS